MKAQMKWRHILNEGSFEMAACWKSKDSIWNECSSEINAHLKWSLARNEDIFKINARLKWKLVEKVKTPFKMNVH